MENQEVLQKPRPQPSKSTRPQPGRPVPSRAYPGALIVVEGTDGSGKSTQLYLLKRWLEIGGYRLPFTEWKPSRLGSRMSPALAEKSLPVCACAGHYVLFSRAAGRGRPSHPERASQTQILRSGNGYGAVVR